MVQRQLKEYFSGSRCEFSLVYELIRIEFQKQVWNSLKDIPYGETTTYLEIAKK